MSSLININTPKTQNITSGIATEPNLIKSAKSITEPFKRTISRLYELTSMN